MFPITDDSQTIVDCLQRAAHGAGVTVRLQCGVKSVERAATKTGASGNRSSPFAVHLTTGEVVGCDRLLLATGGNKTNAGFEIARQFGHAIEPPVPSLFTFHVKDARLQDLSGVSVEQAIAAVPGTASARARFAPVSSATMLPLTSYWVIEIAPPG